MSLPLPTIDRLREVLRLDPETGHLYWRGKPGKNMVSGARAGGLRNGYRNVCVDYRQLLAHRVIWAMTYGEWPASHVDHINTDRDDNRPCNLRLATHAQNLHNRPASRISTSGFKGVQRCKKGRPWGAQIGVNGTKRWLGRYDTAEQAAAAYLAAAKELHGEFARTVR